MERKVLPGVNSETWQEVSVSGTQNSEDGHGLDQDSRLLTQMALAPKELGEEECLRKEGFAKANTTSAALAKDLPRGQQAL